MIKKRLLSVLLATGFLFSLAGCDITDIQDTAQSQEIERTQEFTKEEEQEFHQSDVTEIENKDKLTKEEQKEFENNYQNFAVNLLKESRKNADTKENIMISPLSVLTALTMTENGAKGETLTQMEQVLATGKNMEQQNKALVHYINSLSNSEKVRLNQANSIWFNTANLDFQVKESFLEKNKESYQADIFRKDFTEHTKEEINQWVNNETNEMIPQILDKIPDEAIMYLINAIAFEGEWEEVYKGNNVWERDFDNGEEISKVSMMFSEETKFVEDENTTGFLKPYKDGYEFLALLPKEGISIDEYLEGLTGEKLQRMLENMIDTNIQVHAGIPKFSSDFSIELSDSLKNMGMELAFDQQKADFSGIGTVEGGKNLFIGRVLHKTHISVYEEGTKASASTIVEIALGAVRPDEKIRMESVILNRPFLYAIVDKESRLPVFLGVTDSIKE